MGISVLYVRISSLDGKTDRQRVNQEEFDRVIEDKCSGSIPIFEREGGRQLKKWIDEGVISSISIWQIDRSGRDLRDILNFIHYTTQRKIPIHFISQGLRTIDENGEDSDLFDVLSFVAFHSDLIPRLERRSYAKIHLESYNSEQQDFLNFVLDQYVKKGVSELSDDKLKPLIELKYNTIADAKRVLGSPSAIRETFIGFQKYLYNRATA